MKEANAKNKCEKESMEMCQARVRLILLQAKLPSKRDK